ncbi:MAG TPA: C1 family peptidase [Terracidiphilus sp.]|nr:C1 family peptidase [Terracidiphilus sp.]
MDPHGFDNLGHLTSPYDARDFKLNKVNKLIGAAGPIPPSYFADLSKLPVLMQAQKPSCIGHATAAGMMQKDNGAYSWDYSPRFLYALCKRDDGIAADGTYYRQALKEGTAFGVCDNAQFPNDVTLDTPTYQNASLIPQTAFDIAKSRLVKSYVALSDLSFAGLKQAIYQNGVVLLGVELGNEWWTAPNGSTSWAKADILPLRPPATVTSGHAVLMYGYDENYIYIRNSWSAEWGDNGNGYFGQDYIPFIQEGWTFMDLAPEVVAQLKQKADILTKIVGLYQQILSLVKGRNQSQ